MIGYIILTITLAAFLAIAVYILVKMFKMPGEYSGNKFTSSYKGKNAIVYIDKSIKLYKNQFSNKTNHFIINEEEYSAIKLAELCAKAMYVTKISFDEKNIKTSVKKTVFVFQPDHVFEQTAWDATWAKKVGAYAVQYKSMFNVKTIDVIYIKAKFIENVYSNGFHAIHEMIHVLNKDAGFGYNHAHDDQKLWSKFGNNTIEIKSIEKFKTIKE